MDKDRMKFILKDNNTCAEYYSFIKYVCAEDGTEFKLIAFMDGQTLVTLADALGSEKYTVINSHDSLTEALDVAVTALGGIKTYQLNRQISFISQCGVIQSYADKALAQIQTIRGKM